MHWQRIDHEPARVVDAAPRRTFWLVRLARILFPPRGRCTVCKIKLTPDEDVCPTCARDLAW